MAYFLSLYVMTYHILIMPPTLKYKINYYCHCKYEYILVLNVNTEDWGHFNCVIFFGVRMFV